MVVRIRLHSFGVVCGIAGVVVNDVRESNSLLGRLAPARPFCTGLRWGIGVKVDRAVGIDDEVRLGLFGSRVDRSEFDRSAQGVGLLANGGYGVIH